MCAVVRIAVLISFGIASHFVGAIKIMTDDVKLEVQAPSNVSIYGKFHGHDGVRKFFATLRELLNTEAVAVRSMLAID